MPAARPRAPRDAFAAACARLAPRLMRDLGLSDLQAAGLLGNLGHETGGFCHLQEIEPAVKGSRGGWGLAQWTGPRRVAMEAWARARGLDPACEEANVGYLCEELRTAEAGALAALRRAPTLEAATETVCLRFERPGVVAMTARLAWARRALDALRRAAAAPAAAPDAGPGNARTAASPSGTPSSGASPSGTSPPAPVPTARRRGVGTRAGKGTGAGGRPKPQ